MENFKLKRILVPMDFTKRSYNALDTAIAVCQQQGGSLTLMHVVDNTKVIIPPKREAITVPVTQLTRLASENLNVLCKSLQSKYDIDIKFVVEAGVPAHFICEHARKNNFDLIVIGSRNIVGLRGLFTETVTYKVVKASPCPVLSVPSTRLFTKFRKVIFPVRNAPRMLDKYEIVRPILNTDESILMLTGLTEANDAESFKSVSVTMHALQCKLRYDHVANSSRLYLCESVSDRLLEISTSEKPDLIVIMAMIDKSIRRFFLEYFAKTIVSSAQCPVLSIRPDMAAVN